MVRAAWIFCCAVGLNGLATDSFAYVSSGIKSSALGKRLASLHAPSHSPRQESCIKSTCEDPELLAEEGITSVLNGDKLQLPLTADPENYRYFELTNGMKVMVARDEATEKASACLSISHGAADDPHNRAGMAHFTEHMLFLGTKAFPKENHYKEYLAKNGGRSNGGTGQ
jgi:hypothetical protein